MKQKTENGVMADEGADWETDDRVTEGLTEELTEGLMMG